MEEFEEMIRAALYPIRMLGTGVEVHVQDTGPVSSDLILQPSQIALQMAGDIVDGSAWTTIMRIKAASLVVGRLGSAAIWPEPSWRLLRP
jgi:hypothetical protein